MGFDSKSMCFCKPISTFRLANLYESLSIVSLLNLLNNIEFELIIDQCQCDYKRCIYLKERIESYYSTVAGWFHTAASVQKFRPVFLSINLQLGLKNVL